MTSRLSDWLERIEKAHPSTIELGLDRCAAVWERMGSPRPARRLITVAGTNGKGSTVAGIETGLRYLGRSVATYTSPHLVRYNERVRIDGQEATDEAIIAGFEAVEAAVSDTRLTYFEFATLAAFATISRAVPDFAVLEIGLGGRLDAVNLLDADIAVITPIGLDHQEYLGSDRESIGREKAGIMRPGQTVVCGDRDPPESVYAVAEGLGARMIRIGADFDIARNGETGAQGPWRYFYSDLETSLRIAMAGAHQSDNLATALTAVMLSDDDARPRLDGVADALAACRVRGRLESIASNPEVIVDVGHNPLAARVIRAFLDDRGATSCRGVLGMLNDKDAEGVGAVLADRIGVWFCAGLGGARGQSGEALARRLRTALPTAAIKSFETVAEAVDAAIREPGDCGPVLVFGSFHTAGEAIVHLEQRNC